MLSVSDLDRERSPKKCASTQVSISLAVFPSSGSLSPFLFTSRLNFMQTAVDALKSVMSTSNTSNSSSAPELFNKGWTPDAEKGKEAQGGDDSRPPGKQHTMVGESFLLEGEE